MLGVVLGAADVAADAEELMLREALEQSLLWGKAEEEAREEGLIPDFLVTIHRFL